MKNTGLEELAAHFDEMQKAFHELDGTLGTIQFNANDPASIEAATQECEAMVDARLRRYSANPTLREIAQAAKEKFREGIAERAAAARLESRND